MKYFKLILGILCLVTFVRSFFYYQETSEFIGIEMNIWVFRLIWGILAVGFFYGYFKKKKSEKE